MYNLIGNVTEEVTCPGGATHDAQWENFVVPTAVSAGLSMAMTMGFILLYGWDSRLRKHPRELIFARAVIDFVMALIVVFDKFANFTKDSQSAACRDIGAVVESLALSGELYVGAIAVDLIRSISDPFMDAKHSRRVYHVFIIGFSALVALVARFSSWTVAGQSQTMLGYNTLMHVCWVDLPNDGTSKIALDHFSDFTDTIWTIYAGPVYVVYFLVCWACVYAITRLNSGIQDTLQPRLSALIDTIRYAIFMFLFQVAATVCLFVVYFRAKNAIQHDEEFCIDEWNLALVVIISGRGVITTIGWGLGNDAINAMRRLCCRCSCLPHRASAGAGKTEIELHNALRRELVSFLSIGIRKATLAARRRTAAPILRARAREAANAQFEAAAVAGATTTMASPAGAGDAAVAAAPGVHTAPRPIPGAGEGRRGPGGRMMASRAASTAVLNLHGSRGGPGSTPGLSARLGSDGPGTGESVPLPRDDAGAMGITPTPPTSDPRAGEGEERPGGGSLLAHGREHSGLTRRSGSFDSSVETPVDDHQHYLLHVSLETVTHSGARGASRRQPGSRAAMAGRVIGSVLEDREDMLRDITTLMNVDEELQSGGTGMSMRSHGLMLTGDVRRGSADVATLSRSRGGGGGAAAAGGDGGGAATAAAAAAAVASLESRQPRGSGSAAGSAPRHPSLVAAASFSGPGARPSASSTAMSLQRAFMTDDDDEDEEGGGGGGGGGGGVGSAAAPTPPNPRLSRATSTQRASTLEIEPGKIPGTFRVSMMQLMTGTMDDEDEDDGDTDEVDDVDEADVEDVVSNGSRGSGGSGGSWGRRGREPMLSGAELAPLPRGERMRGGSAPDARRPGTFHAGAPQTRDGRTRSAAVRAEDLVAPRMRMRVAEVRTADDEGGGRRAHHDDSTSTVNPLAASGHDGVAVPAPLTSSVASGGLAGSGASTTGASSVAGGTATRSRVSCCGRLLQILTCGLYSPYSGRWCSRRRSRQELLYGAYSEQCPSLLACLSCGRGLSDKGATLVDYAPAIFQEIRERDGVPAWQYAAAICRPMVERITEGASGSFMYFSSDHRFIVKTVTHGEAAELLQILQAYRAHLRHTPGSLMTRFYGLYSLLVYGHRLHVVVMANLHRDAIHCGLETIQRFDLKGSWVSRATRQVPRPLGPANGEATASLARRSMPHGRMDDVLKDMDVPGGMNLNLHPSIVASAASALARDAAFLAKHGIMDYSLLLGVHMATPETDQARLAEAARGGSRALGPKETPHGPPGTPLTIMDSGNKLFVSMGVIDVLQLWNTEKVMERFAKTRLACKDAAGISAVGPEAFRDRFIRNVVERVVRSRGTTERFHSKDWGGSVGSKVCLCRQELNGVQ